MRLASRLVALASLLALPIVPLPQPAHAAASPFAASPFAAPPPAGVSPWKARQMRMLALEPMQERRERLERVERMRELRRLAKRMKANGETSVRVRGERSRPEALDEDARTGRTAAATDRARLATPAFARAAQAILPNVRCNDPSGDLLSAGFGGTVVEGQCETAIVRWNNYMVAAWNDGKGFDDHTNQVQGWAISTDGGQTWNDQGYPTVPSSYPGWTWTSDPTLAVNPATGAFYFAALGSPDLSRNSIGVLKGRFTGNSFALEQETASRIVSNSTDGLDKQWIAVDPVNGRVYLSYTDFTSAGDEIDFQWADSSLATWSAYRKLSTTLEDGWVQGSRPAVDSNGNVYVVYYLIGQIDTDSYRIAHSSDRGVTFGAPTSTVTFYPNFGSGAPGFNRSTGIQFPSIAVDRSGGMHDGRIHLAWGESLNWFDDAANAGNAGNQFEAEPNDAPTDATPITLGTTVRGSCGTVNDFDYYALALTAGQTVIAELDSLATGVTVTMRMLAGDGVTRLAFLQAADTDITPGYAPPTWIFTAPTTGTYYLRIADVSGTGGYVLSTGAATRTTERGRDQRDVFTAYSDNQGATWSTPVRVNQDAVGFDDWLPEVSVAPDGQVACAWFDWRDATPSTDGGESSVYLATSDDGGATWSEKGAISDARSPWTAVGTNIVPNQGDYLSMYATLDGLAVAWSDGRNLNPDVYMEWIASDRPVLTLAHGVTGRVDLAWYANRAPGATAALYRQVGSAATWDSVTTLTLDATQHFTYTDTTGITTGLVLRYELGLVTGGVEQFYSPATVQIGNPTLELAGTRPSPAHQDGTIAFTLATDAPATLTMLDLHGRKIYSVTVSGVGTHTLPVRHDGQHLDPGVYFLRLEQSGASLSRRIVVI